MKNLIFFRRFRWTAAGVAAAAVAAVGGCSAGDPAVGSYSSDRLYDKSLPGELSRAAYVYDGVERRPVVVIHGFLGARLRDAASGGNVWGEIAVSDALRYSPEHLRAMALPMARGKRLRELTGGVVADGLLSRFKVRFSALEFEIEGYQRLLDILRGAGYRTPDDLPTPEHPAPTLFVFAYDWRRDLPENAARLDAFLKRLQREVGENYRKHYGVDHYDVQFHIVAHSMGGLLTRYYLRYGGQDLPADGSLPRLDWRGSRLVSRAILVGTPNAGYLDTCIELISGLRYARGAAPYPPAVLGTFPSYYQMMPPASNHAVLDERGRPLDLFDPEVWKKYGWGLLDPEQDEVLRQLLPEVATRDGRYAVAFDHLTKCLRRARQFQRALRVPADRPPGLSLLLFLGDSVETSRRAKVDPDDGRPRVIEFDSGDGKVLATSARGDMRPGAGAGYPFELSPILWDGVIHLPGAHMGIIQNALFRDNVLYQLRQNPDRRQRDRVWKLLNELP